MQRRRRRRQRIPQLVGDEREVLVRLADELGVSLMAVRRYRQRDPGDDGIEYDLELSKRDSGAPIPSSADDRVPQRSILPYHCVEAETEPQALIAVFRRGVAVVGRRVARREARVF